MASISTKRGIALMSVFGIFIILFSFCAGIAGTLFANRFLSSGVNYIDGNVTVSSNPASDARSSLVNVAHTASESVVSIVISKDLSKLEQLNTNPFYQYFNVTPNSGSGNGSNGSNGSGSSSGTSTLQQVGAGSGFIISADGLILTNKHVVSDTTATYTVILNDGSKYPATVVARDTILDIAVVKISTDKTLTALVLGDSDSIAIGQTAIAIGNSLGEFSNTVSAGIISGLGRTIVAGDSTGIISEQLTNVIQTDAGINPGNSGGPLLDIDGKVIGVNVAVAEDAQSIGFAIPINSVKTIVDSVSKYGKIIRPYIGVRYTKVDDEVAKTNNLKVNYGAYVTSGTSGAASTPAVVVGGPAEKAGIKAGDVIIAINDQKLNDGHDLQSEVQKFKVGDTIKVTVQRGDQALDINVTLEERPAE